VFYPLVSWLLFIGAGACMWFKKDMLKNIWSIVDRCLWNMYIDMHPVRYWVLSLPLLWFWIAWSMHTMDGLVYVSVLVWVICMANYLYHGFVNYNWWIEQVASQRWIVQVLTLIMLILTFWYLFQGMQLAFLPYPTAWDANHAYMFFPKMWALEWGYYWNEAGMSVGVDVWLAYIAYFFSLFAPFDGFLGISIDTIAIQMNFFSGILVLIFWLWLISEVIEFFSAKQKKNYATISSVVFMVWRFMLLQWLMSGMWAFLVFIDNKTDMGVLALITLALYSWFVFLNKIRDTEIRSEIVTYICVSWFLYGIAALAKPTALFDVVNFGLFLWVLWFGIVGAVWLFLVVLWWMTWLDFRWIKDYIPQSLASWFAWVWILWFWIDAVKIYLKKSWEYIRYLLVWWWVIVVTIVVVKLPFMLWKIFINDATYTPWSFIQSLLLSEASPDILLAQNWDTSLWFAACSLEGQWISDPEMLYTTTTSAPGDVYNEDVGRYVWFWWKGNAETDARRKIIPLIEPLWAFWMEPGCYWFNLFAPSYAKDAKSLCEVEASVNSLDLNTLQSLYASVSNSTLHKGVPVKDILWEIVTWLESSTNPVNNLTALRPQLQSLQAFMQENTIKVINNNGIQEVYAPYKYLVPSNITFNRSLQNLSSYYTDIGVVWLFMLYFVVLGLVYGMIHFEKKLIWLSLATLFGWSLWWLIWWAILWYAIWLIIWTIIAFIAFLYVILEEEEDEDSLEHALKILFIVCILVFAWFQMILNMVRISSQWGGGAFLWYKTGYGQVETFGDNLQPTTTLDRSFGADNVFDMQFRHYKKFLWLANTSLPKDWSLIAGTYARYFVEDQTNVKYDQFLTWLWEMFSDGDACKSYLRLQDQNIKYIVVDPNIWTVVQWGWNQSLFDRFFARVDAGSNTLIEHGVMTMLVNLYQQWYVRYVSSNNIGAKYAFTLPDSTFTGLSGDDLILQRTRMALSRYFRSPSITNAILQVAEQRVNDGYFVTDIADILWLEIRENVLMWIIAKWQVSPADMQELTQDERKAMSQLLTLRTLWVNNPDALRQQLQTIIWQSTQWWNQLIVLERN